MFIQGYAEPGNKDMLYL